MIPQPFGVLVALTHGVSQQCGTPITDHAGVSILDRPTRAFSSNDNRYAHCYA